LEDLETSLLPEFDSALAASTCDAAEVARLAPELNVTVYPNAIPTVRRPESVKDSVLIFSGNLRYHPNRRAIGYFHREIWPQIAATHPGLHWRLVGKNPEAVRDVVGNDPRVECTGPIVDAVAAIARGLIAVVPLLSGSGTRVKILEAWAAGVPVVSTVIGAEGLEARPGEEILIAHSPEEFVSLTRKLLDSPALQALIGAAGRKRYEADYTWEAAWSKLDTLNL
jgi:glycosyltransferase involved in cell wall biosynthesis